MAPEILRHQYYNSNADIWSLGILLYEMLHGCSPFKGSNVRNTMTNILRNNISFDKCLQGDTKEVIVVILNRDSEERPKICEILDSSWAKRMEMELNEDIGLNQYKETFGCGLNSPKSKPATETINKSSSESTSEENEDEAKKYANAIRWSVMKIVRVQGKKRNLHRKLVREMFVLSSFT